MRSELLREDVGRDQRSKPFRPCTTLWLVPLTANSNTINKRVTSLIKAIASLGMSTFLLEVAPPGSSVGQVFWLLKDLKFNKSSISEGTVSEMSSRLLE